MNNVRVIVICLLAFLLNVNTLTNEYAMDDAVVFTENVLVNQGLHGIPKLLVTDMFYGVGKHDVALAAGRYRPLSMVSFAIEKHFFGINHLVSHLINVLLFVLLMYLLFTMLSVHVLKHFPIDVSFYACLIFLAHPIHTEVIANVKSRDEIMTLIFMLLTGFAYVKYIKTKSFWIALAGLGVFFLALLTKEAALPMVIIVPLVAYFFYNQSLWNALKLSWPLLLVVLLYMPLRIAIVGLSHTVGTEIMNYPFAYATPSEAFATKVFVMFKYLQLLLVPFPLICDYGYNQVPYVGILSLKFILPAAILVALIVVAIWSLKSRHILGFAVIFFFSTIALCSNFIVDVGAFMAERFLFQPSLAYAIGLSWGLVAIKNKINPFIFKLLQALGVIILCVYSYQTVKRNLDWKNDDTLYVHDINFAPNSLRVNYNVGTHYNTLALAEPNPEMKQELYQKALNYQLKSLEMYRHYPPIYQEVGIAYMGMADYLKAADYWWMGYRMDNQNPMALKRVNLMSDILFNLGNRSMKVNAIDSARAYYEKSFQLNPQNQDAQMSLLHLPRP